MMLSLMIAAAVRPANIESRVESLLSKMTLDEKLGQMSQTYLPDKLTPELRKQIVAGRFGSIYGWGSAKVRAECQSLARQSRLHIPLMLGMDIIHGWTTGLPIPLAQAASFDPDLVQACARIAAREATPDGINWTFSPMLDIARDPRWGRIAEGYGEDPYLDSRMGVAMVRGYQGSDLSNPDSIAPCAKHFVGYGAAEGGRDYNSTWIPEQLLRDVYLKPFKAVKDAGIATYMSAFNAINGVPATANELTLRQILRNEWGFNGFVVSDYTAVHELIQHGVAANGAEAAQKAIRAGVDMEMISRDYYRYGKQLIQQRKLDRRLIDDSVRRILRVKFELGLFDGRPQKLPAYPLMPQTHAVGLSQRLATESLVLLKNDGVLPLKSEGLGKLAIIGQLANSKRDQLGTWASTDENTAQTPLEALRGYLGQDRVMFDDGKSIDSAVTTASSADVVVVFLGETADMSGEASSRSDIGLPGNQVDLLSAVAKTGKPVIGVIMAGRPLAFHDSVAKLNAILYAWHGGPQAGPAIATVLIGMIPPSGRLPVTFPRSVGQIPIYYDHLNTGRPPGDSGEAATDKYRSKYIDVSYKPEYPFGYGLSYTTFKYSATRASAKKVKRGLIVLSVDVTNTGKVAATETVQLYTHQRSASIARPVRELKGFARISLFPGQKTTVRFPLPILDLAFVNGSMKSVVEPGVFDAWLSHDSASGTPVQFEVVK